MTVFPLSVDLILLGLIAEAVLGVWWLRGRQKPHLRPAFLSFLAAGFVLMLALRWSITDGHWAVLGLLLALSGLLHVACLLAIWRLGRREP